ncbi:MAG: cytochrome c [Gemmatimonadaceae bacterium]|nr:cytochrome c [Gemmatimonadaceae bacterium]
MSLSSLLRLALLTGTVSGSARELLKLESSPIGEGMAMSAAVVASRLQVDGKALYLEHCKACHGVLGAPTKQALKKYNRIPSFADPGFFAKRSDDSLVTVVRKGAGRDMQSLADKLSNEEMRAVARYIRTLAKAP